MGLKQQLVQRGGAFTRPPCASIARALRCCNACTFKAWSLKMKFCELIIFFCRFERFLQAAIMVIFCGLLVFNVLPGWDGGAGGLGFTGMFATIQSQKPIANNASAGFFAAIIIIVRCSSPCDITQPALVRFIDDTGLFKVVLYSRNAQFQAMRAFHFLMHPQKTVHAFNVVILIGVIPFWFATRPTYMISGAVPTLRNCAIE